MYWYYKDGWNLTYSTKSFIYFNTALNLHLPWSYLTKLNPICPISNHYGGYAMKILIIAAIIAALGIYIYFSRHIRKYRNDNQGRRSGTDRRKSFIASKNRIQRSNKERRQTSDRRRVLRYAWLRTLEYRNAVPVLWNLSSFGLCSCKHIIVCVFDCDSTMSDGNDLIGGN